MFVCLMRASGVMGVSVFVCLMRASGVMGVSVFCVRRASGIWCDVGSCRRVSGVMLVAVGGMCTFR